MEMPERPNDSDCCNSGCIPCIFDVYEEQMEKYGRGEKQLNEDLTKNNCISPFKYSIFRLLHKEYHTSDTLLLVFEFHPEDPSKALDTFKLTYRPGDHLLLKNESGENNYFTRAYTPIPIKTKTQINLKHNQLSFVVLIKLYEKGKMSNFIKNLQMDSLTKWRGPYGNFTISFKYKNILCLSQGVGIAPVFNIICSILENEECETRIKLYACHKNVNSIILRNEIHDFKRYWNFDCTTFLAHETKNLNDTQTFIKYNEEIEFKKLNECDIENYFSSKCVDKANTLVLICGTDLFNKNMLSYIEKYNVTTHVF